MLSHSPTAPPHPRHRLTTPLLHHQPPSPPPATTSAPPLPPPPSLPCHPRPHPLRHHHRPHVRIILATFTAACRLPPPAPPPPHLLFTLAIACPQVIIALALLQPHWVPDPASTNQAKQPEWLGDHPQVTGPVIDPLTLTPRTERVRCCQPARFTNWSQ